MKKNIHIAFIVSSLFLILFSYNNCEGGKKSNNDSDTSLEGGEKPLIPDNDGDDDGSKVEDIDIDNHELEGEVTNYESGPSEVESSFFSVMTAEGILNSYSSVTGVPFLYEDDSGEVPILTENGYFFSRLGYTEKEGEPIYYNSVKANLPNETTLDKFNSSSLNSIVSLSSSFCEEAFIGTHPLSEDEYINSLPNLELHNEDPEESDVISFVDKLLTWLVPHITVNERGKDIIRRATADRVDSFVAFKNSGIEKHVFHDDYLSTTFVVSGDETSGSADVITFEESFFLSYFIMPEDSGNGFTNPTGINDKQLLTISSEYGFFQLKHSVSGHSIYADIYTYNSALARYRTARFVINDPGKNRLKMKAYNVVIEYVADPSIGNKVSVEDDFNIYINGEKTNLYSINNYFWADYYSGVDKRFDKETIFFGTAKEVGGEMVSVGSSISLKNDLRLPIGNIEFFKGTYEDVIKNATEESKPFLFDGDGDFTFARTTTDATSRGASVFFGRLATEDDNERVLYFSTDAGTFQRNKMVDSSSQSISNTGFNIKRKVNQSWVVMTPEELNSSFAFNVYDAEITFPKPFLSIAPLMCTAVMSSGYFIFN